MDTEPQTSRVLVVEDDRQLLELLRRQLAGAGYEVDVAIDGQRGLHLGLTRSYDIMVLDRRLPGIEGLDLLTRLRAHGVSTPALMLSALANPADRVVGLDAGAEDYLGEPFDVNELLARLRAQRRRHLVESPLYDTVADVTGHHPHVPRVAQGYAAALRRRCTGRPALAGRPVVRQNAGTETGSKLAVCRLSISCRPGVPLVSGFR